MKEYILTEYDTPFTALENVTGELIRCKDCKYYEETDAQIGTCLLTESGAQPYGYCWWAERKEDA